ncbi:MAG: family 14 glycosylhydrolase [Clostridia bacterium]|nr:family 14 glycosylhydrolase [Clostridia bacterium]
MKFRRSIIALMLPLMAGFMVSCDSVVIPSEIPETIEAVSLNTSRSKHTVTVDKYPAASLPDYSNYTTAGRIKEVLGNTNSYAFTLGGSKYFAKGELKDGGNNIVGVNENGTVTVDSAALGALIGKSGLSGELPQVVAAGMKMGCAIYDHKLVLFFDGDAPLDTYEDMYTFEAMHLYMTNASEEDMVNAFIDLPSRVSNGTSNTVFYTAPDLNLGLQTSVYYAQMGQMNGLTEAPALVAGEGRHEDNFTTVRIYNNQNTCTTQFLAFDASVKGGVQVAAAKVGDEVLIATAPFAAYKGNDGDVRIFDTFGLLRMVIRVRNVFSGPYTIATGRFSKDRDDEVLLVASRNTNKKGELQYVLISLSDGSVISAHTLKCSFALTNTTSGVPVEISVRNLSEGIDPVILYFNSVQAVFEGNAETAVFNNSGIQLPEDAIGVSASTLYGQKYIVALPAREGEEDLSYVAVYDDAGTEGSLLDIGFMENRFYSSLDSGQESLLEYNDDKYVSKGKFCHIRTEYSSKAFASISSCKTNKEIDEWFDNSSYSDYAVPSLTSTYTNKLGSEYLMLEPCFTARWHKGTAFGKLGAYKDPYDNEQKYLSYGPDGKWSNAVEVDPEWFLTGTYADGIMETAKIRLYPLRDFLQNTAIAFRGEGATPEHLVGVSPVHEQEIAVANGVGDYNPYMIEGFRNYLIDRYGSVANINSIFGTNFKSVSAIDAPRDDFYSSRGDWDKYEGEYFEEWVMYNRYIVSKRIMEAYREALLAGYPPESITAHQIPEADAIAGFLGSADKRISPIDIVLTCGTGYGGTRYGMLSEYYNIAYNAHLAGHSNITLGEYGSMTQKKKSAYKQLKMLWSNGVHMTQQMIFDGEYLDSELYAITTLAEENLPRPGYTGGTAGSLTVNLGEKEYNIVQIGASGGEKPGLLKSVDASGRWEGSVYLVPFHTQITAETLTALAKPVKGSKNVFSTGNVGTIKNSDQVEITFTAAKKGDARAWVTFEVYNRDCLMPESVTEYELTETMTAYRYVLSNQIYDSGLEVRVTFHSEVSDGSMNSIRLENMLGTVQKENIGFAYFDKDQCNALSKAHVGGVTFDILELD